MPTSKRSGNRALAPLGDPGRHRPDAIREGITSLKGARRTGEAELLLAYTGGNPLLTPSDWCWTGVVPELDFEADRVLVSLHQLRRNPDPRPPPGTGCTQEGYTRNIAVALAELLAGRQLVDAKTGENRPLFDDELLRPLYLPEGLELVVETGAPATPNAPGGRSSPSPWRPRADGPASN